MRQTLAAKLIGLVGKREDGMGPSADRQNGSKLWLREFGLIPIAVFLVALTGAFAVADDVKPPFVNYELTDDEIARALEGVDCPTWTTHIHDREPGEPSPSPSMALFQGRLEKGVGLLLEDSKHDKWANGLYINVLTPYSWICIERRHPPNGKPFTVETVTADMRRDVLRVFASPGMIMRDARKHGPKYFDYGMTHVTIRSTAKKDYEVLEPTSVERVREAWQCAAHYKTRPGGDESLGGPMCYPEMMLVFDLQRVAEISKLDKKGELFVVLANTLGKERKLKIKTKHFKKLP